MAKVLGIGGVFFKSPDPRRLCAWYSKTLGIHVDPDQTFSVFKPGDFPKEGYTVWSAFKATTDYFEPSKQEFMMNLIVDDLDGAIAQVKEGGGTIVGDIQQMDYGRFGWILDPDGNKVELWEIPKG